jgi:amino acid transporter
MELDQDTANAAVTAPHGELRHGALKLPGILMQSFGFVAPAVSIIFYVGLLAPNAGIGIPLVFLVAAVFVVISAVVLVQLAKKIPSAGGYFAYTTETVHPRAGFLVGWFVLLYTPVGLVFIPVLLGSTIQQELIANYGFNLPWWAFFVASLLVTAALVYRGIVISGRALIFLGGFELLIVLGLATFGLVNPGHGGTTLAPFNPNHLLGTHGFYLAVILAISAYVGWEGAAPIAEEAQMPTRKVPQAMLICVALVVVVYIFSMWGIIVGFGTAKGASGLINSAELPPLAVAHRVWGSLWWVALLALLNSVMASNIACMNIATRMWFDTARAGILPARLGELHPRFKTPVNAILLSLIVPLVVGLALGLAIGPTETFTFFATMGPITITFYYVMANVGVIRAYRGRWRSEYNPILHLVFPVVATVAFLWVLYKSFNPLPTGPAAWALPLAVAWFLLGVGVLIVMRRRGDAWLRKARVAIEGGYEPGTDAALLEHVEESSVGDPA